MLKGLISLFKIRKEERLASLVALAGIVMLNALNVVRYYSALIGVDNNTWSKFIKGWHVSGFDPITYSVITEWRMGYNVYRHPLLAYFVWPFTKINEGLMSLANMNFAIVVTALILVFCAFYSFVFLTRIFGEIMGLRRSEVNVLGALTFSFAYIMLSAFVPDHFIMSMFCLTLTLYISGLKLKRSSALNLWQTVVLFFITAGVSLNNGLKVFLAALVTRRKRFFNWRYLLLALALPTAMIWASARLGYRYFVWPREVAHHEKMLKNRKAQLERLQTQAIANVDADDTARISFLKDSVKKSLDDRRERRKMMSAAYKHTGKPIAEGEFMRWTDCTTSRVDAAVENVFGEGVMLHEDYLLGDVLVNRPVIVRYNNWGNYIVELFLVLAFVAGVWYGRKSLFLWTAMSFFLMDMALHMGLGFGINEIFIMSAHYLFVLPVAMAYLLKALPERWRKRLTVALGVVALYLIVWNVSLIVQYLYIL